MTVKKKSRRAQCDLSIQIPTKDFRRALSGHFAPLACVQSQRRHFGARGRSNGAVSESGSANPRSPLSATPLALRHVSSPPTPLHCVRTWQQRATTLGDTGMREAPLWRVDNLCVRSTVSELEQARALFPHTERRGRLQTKRGPLLTSPLSKAPLSACMQ